MSDDVMDRRVVLGGQTRGRGILTGTRQPLEWAGMAATGLLLVPVLTGGHLGWVQLVLTLLVLGVAFGAWTPFPGPLDNRSVAAHVAGWDRWWSTRRSEPVFVPGERFAYPKAVGLVRPVTVELPDGSPLALVRHANPGRAHFWTACFERIGESAGLVADWEFGAAHEGWGRFLSGLARQGSLVRTVQEVTRVVPYDTADHTRWVMAKVPKDVPAVLGQSYVQLLDLAAEVTEQHRGWVVFRIPVTPVFSLQARQIGRDAEAVLVAREMGAVIERAAACGLALRPLTESRLAGVLRSLQDPAWPIDRLAGLTFDTAWLPLDQRPRRHVVVRGADGDQLVRSAVVPVDGVEPGRFAPDFLHPLLSGVSPSVVRTISTVTNLVPAHKARSEARQDVTVDRAAKREAALKVTDGSEDEQLTASSQRLRDLRPGTGHQGADWGMVLTVTARSADALATACRQVEDAAQEARITRLRWLDGDQQAGLVASLPLGRGLEVRK